MHETSRTEGGVRHAARLLAEQVHLSLRRRPVAGRRRGRGPGHHRDPPEEVSLAGSAYGPGLATPGAECKI
ncbi:hypothetical protein [Ktedonospora formicarum]|uniref:hypothetical protein n=1 Tax=Ktedonospora formicarum TaxID=2778364 RepID=UPI001C68A195|nr:hypothetical protein [Ktedonospora formicarum]